MCVVPENDGFLVPSVNGATIPVAIKPLNVPNPDEKKDQAIKMTQSVPERNYKKVEIQVSNADGKKMAAFETVLFTKAANQ